MRKTLTHIALFCLISISAFSQQASPDTISYWKKKLIMGLNINQASFSTNWKAGGVNSIGLNSMFNYKAAYKKNKTSWDNEIDLLYGFVNNQGQGYRKTNDRIFLDTKVGHSLNSVWDLYTSVSFQTQFTAGYKYNADNTKQQISDNFAPAFITSSWGFAYHPVSYFSVRISPFSPRITIVDNPRRFVKSVGPAPYGIDTTKNVRYEWLAFQLTAEFNKDIAKNVNLKWRYLMYANYETLAPKKIDHRLDVNITAKVNKYVNTSLGAILLYDYDQDTSVQLSQLFTLGIVYTLQNYSDK